MTVFYNKTLRGNPADPDAPKKWFPVLRSIGKLKEKDVAKKVSDETTLNRKEAEMALCQLEKVLVEALLDGTTVQLGEMGTFKLTIKTKGSDTKDEATAMKIEKAMVRFVPSVQLREAIAKIHFSSTDNIKKD